MSDWWFFQYTAYTHTLFPPSTHVNDTQSIPFVFNSPHRSLFPGNNDEARLEISLLVAWSLPAFYGREERRERGRQFFVLLLSPSNCVINAYVPDAKSETMPAVRSILLSIKASKKWPHHPDPINLKSRALISSMPHPHKNALSVSTYKQCGLSENKSSRFPQTV